MKIQISTLTVATPVFSEQSQFKRNVSYLGLVHAIDHESGPDKYIARRRGHRHAQRKVAFHRTILKVPPTPVAQVDDPGALRFSFVPEHDVPSFPCGERRRH